MLPLPTHPFDTDLVRSVRAEKTPYVRFDLNDYSIPPCALGRSLTLVASPTTVRLLDGATEIARHRRGSTATSGSRIRPISKPCSNKSAGR